MQALWLPEYKAFLRYHDLPGALPAVVFIHGLGAAGSQSFPMAAAQPCLAVRRRIILDLLGFGFSDRPAGFGYSLYDHAATVARLLDSLNLRGIHLCGHSMGGAVAVALVQRYPELVSRLALCEANLDPGVGGMSKLIAAQDEAAYCAGGHAALMRSLCGDKDFATPGYLGSLTLSDPLALHRSAVGLLKGTEPAQRELFLGMAIPRAYFFGEKSLPEPDVEALGRAGIRTPIIPGAGHGMMEDNPGDFAVALAKFLA